MDTELNLENEYLGITEAAEYLRVSASTLRRWEKKGFLVPERTPTGIRRYTKKQLDDVIQAPQQDYSATQYSPQQVEPLPIATESYPQQSVSNYSVEQHTIQVTPPVFEEEATVKTPEEFSLNEISPAPDEEINELRDFFKKAGYDTSTSTEQNHINSQVEWPTAPIAQDLASAEIQHMYPQNISQPDVVVPVVKKPDTVEEHITNVSQPELPEAAPQIESFWKQVHSPAQERIEVFHEEHSDNTVRTAHNEDLATEQRSYRTDEPTEQDTTSESSHKHYTETEEAPRDTKKAYVRFAVIGLSIFVIAFIAWAAYSYYSAPIELYSPVID